MARACKSRSIPKSGLMAPPAPTKADALSRFDTRATRAANPGSLTARDNWTAEEMRYFLAKAEPTARRFGYVLSVFGSVPREGIGRDLDVLVLAMAPRVPHAQFLRELCSAIGENICDGTEGGDGANISWGNDRWIDLTFASVHGRRQPAWGVSVAAPVTAA